MQRMVIHDLNGEGRWTGEAIQERYREYCKKADVASPLSLLPMTHLGKDAAARDACWIYPVMDKVVAGIEHGDVACKWIGIEFIEEDPRVPFGRILKSNTARALRRVCLTDEDRERLGRRIVAMLIAGQVPHEFRQYAKLLKKTGIGPYWPTIEQEVDRNNRYVMRWYEYLKGA